MSNAIVFGWNRPVPGREKLSAEHFQSITAYFAGLQSKGTITGWEPMFLGAHGGDFNGCFILRGEPAKLDALAHDPAWIEHVMRAEFHLQGVGVTRAFVGSAVMDMMGIWTKLIPPS